MGDVVLPVKSACFSMAFHTQERTIRDGCKARGDRADHLCGGFFLGSIVAGKPIAVILIFALSPGLDWFVRIMAVRTDKMEPQFRRGHSISEFNLYDLPPLNRSGPPDFNLTARVFEFQRP